MRVSQAVKVVFRDAVLYGRIWDFDGGIVIVRTPAGSEVRSGRVWVHPIQDDEDMARLRGFEDDAKRAGQDYSRKEE